MASDLGKTRPVDNGMSGEDAAYSVDDLIRLAEYVRKAERRQTMKRRVRKAGLVALVPFAGPMVGEWWESQQRKGWR